MEIDLARSGSACRQDMTKALRRAVRAPLAGYRAEPAALTLAPLPQLNRRRDVP